MEGSALIKVSQLKAGLNIDQMLAILNWRNTPDEHGNSPVQKLFSRRTRTVVPTSPLLLDPLIIREVTNDLIKDRQAAKAKFDRSAKELPGLVTGEMVRLQPDRKNLTWRKAWVTDEVAPRSYLVETEEGDKYRRNRKFLKKTSEEFVDRRGERVLKEQVDNWRPEEVMETAIRAEGINERSPQMRTPVKEIKSDARYMRTRRDIKMPKRQAKKKDKLLKKGNGRLLSFRNLMKSENLEREREKEKKKKRKKKKEREKREKYVGAGTVTSIRYIMMSLISLPLFLKDPSTIMRPVFMDIMIMLGSGLCMGITSLSGFYSYNFISITDAATIFNAQPVIVLIISSIWLKENIGIFEIFTVFIVLTGVFCVCQPEFIFGAVHSPNSWIGFLSASVTCVGIGFATCMIRRVSTHNPATIIIMQTCITVPVCFIWRVIFPGDVDPQTTEMWIILFAGTTLSGFARVLMTFSLKYEYSYVVSIIGTFEILFTLGLQIAVFNDVPNFISVLGALLVISGVILIILKEKILTKFRKHFNKKHSFRNEKLIDEENKQLLS
ncbi:putative membrane protein [Nymphon striatum]|nr:putative membrane protein [Nymphon striatum]